VSPAGDRDAQHPSPRSTWLHDEAQSSAILVHASRKPVEVLRFKPLLVGHSLQNFVGRRKPGLVRPTDPRVVGTDVGRPLEIS
jgi:hypothetical protein